MSTQNPFEQDMVTMKIPANMGPSISVAGFSLLADKDGCVKVPSRLVPELESHGLTRK